MNIYAFSGNIGADPELRYTPQNKAVCTLSVGVSSGYGDNKTTVWVRAQLWEKRAELAAEAFKKGTKFNGYGEITANHYVAKDGTEKPQLQVRIIDFDLPKRDINTNTPSQQDSAPQSQSAPAGAGNFDDFDDNLPY